MSSPVRYREAGRSYATTAILLSVFVLGFVIDLVAGQGVHHIVGWLLAIAIVVGAEALTVYAARVMRTITISDDEVRVGEESVSRGEIAAVTLGSDPEARVLGRKYATGLPRGTEGVSLELPDGERVVVATRHADRVLAALDVSEVEQRAEIRIAEPDELSLLAEIDDRSESLFRVAGMELPDFDWPADHPTVKRVLVIGRPPVGFAELCEVDGEGYLHEVAVLPSHMRRGYGTALVNAACDWAREQGYAGLALTTFAEVAWNGPFYEALGFAEVTTPKPGLVKIRAHETEVGLDDVGRRVVMRRAL